ncbi:MFS transporter [Gulosibacter molinativorax]|uniref:MFS transporter n=1 Tax=Gulosibacter molinativorax TaxID=256821 RepID=A0ABT7CAS9_9MICO|nr:MFS transporter [Gulosibacter molinativorax]MDJ1372225.1 MFS transporter [Gulosibacter molinativorax]QUY63493.1 MFS transporter [Gulosibacter molinativorax]
MTQVSTSPQPTTSNRERRKVLAATIVGTTVEWYDFFIYAFAAALIFGPQFFGPMGEAFGDAGPTLISFASIGLSFLFRPLGAFLAGHFGDKYGRKPVLVATLLLMGIATSLIGVLPTGSMAATSAVVLLLLRILQGISAGGEWGGAALMAVETAPVGKRNRAGAWPQLGVPFGMLLATGMLTILQLSLGQEAFTAWGWRIAFLFSLVLILIGYIVRRTIEESPVFKQILDTAKKESAPIAVLFRRFPLIVLLAALVFAGDNAVGYMLVGGVVQRYATTPTADGGLVGMDGGQVSLLLNIAAISWAIFTYLGAYIADKIGAKPVFIIGYILMIFAAGALFPLVIMGGDNPIYFVLGTSLLGIPLGFCYGPLSNWYAEVFPASVRFSGVSITYAIGAIIGGAFAPLIVQAIFEANTNAWQGAALYLMIMSGVGLIGSLLLRNRNGIPLGADMEASGKWHEWKPGDPIPEGVKINH